jgi:hypothetical protein
MTKDRGVYGRVADLLDEAKDAMAIGAVFAAIANAEDAIKIMRETQEIRSRGHLDATRPGSSPAADGGGGT